jgi:hypothetical protein
MNNNKIINNKIINSINKIIDIKNDLIMFKNNNYNVDLNIYNNIDFIKNINIENIEYYKANDTKKSNILIYIIYQQLYFKYDKFIIYEIIEK